MIQRIHMMNKSTHNFEQQLNWVIRLLIRSTQTPFNLHYVFFLLLYKRKPIELRLSPRLLLQMRWVFVRVVFVVNFKARSQRRERLTTKMTRQSGGEKLEWSAIIVRMAHLHTSHGLLLNGFNWIFVALLFFVIRKHLTRSRYMCSNQIAEHTMDLVTLVKTPKFAFQTECVRFCDFLSSQ